MASIKITDLERPPNKLENNEMKGIFGGITSIRTLDPLFNTNLNHDIYLVGHSLKSVIVEPANSILNIFTQPTISR